MGCVGEDVQPGCGDRAAGVPPVFWQVRDGLPVAQFFHPDRTALCRITTGRIVESVEVAGDRGSRRKPDR